MKSQEIVTDFILPSGSAGGPVFTAGGAVVGITSFVGRTEEPVNGRAGGPRR